MLAPVLLHASCEADMFLPWLVLLLLPGAVNEGRSAPPADDSVPPVAVATTVAPEESLTRSESTTELRSSEAVQTDAVRLPVPLAATTSTLPGEAEASPSLQPAVPGAMLIKRAEPKKSVFPKRTWWSLTLVQHGTAVFDAWSTRKSITSGRGHELNPLMKPFANSAAVYPALQVLPFGLDYLSRRMLRSRNPALRKIWWLPQAAMTTTFIFSGARNLRVASR